MKEMGEMKEVGGNQKALRAEITRRALLTNY
jgi:hypothetical protein